MRSFFFAGGVVDLFACFDPATVDPGIGHLAAFDHGYLENESGQGRAVLGQARYGFTAVRMDTFDGGNVQRAGQIAHDGVQ